MQLDAVLRIPVAPGQHQLLGVAMGEERRQADTVVRRSRLLAERDDAEPPINVIFNQPFAEPLTDHTVANDDYGLRLRRGIRIVHGCELAELYGGRTDVGGSHGGG
jgi:hypothetical protein